MSLAGPPRKVVVAAATRRRPGMLGQLLTSWAALCVPEGVEAAFLIVENDDTPRARDQVLGAAGLPGPIHYALETVPGIPMARNRGFQEADRLGADLLLYVDDDETVAPDWLAEILAAQAVTGAGLMGGPVQITPPEAGLTALQRLVHRGMTQRFERKERRAARLAAAGRAERITIVTNNWLADMALYRDIGLRFDEGLQFTGGSDTQFCRDARAAGVRTAWAPKAVVFETIPAERLTLAYQFVRGRDQSTTSYRRKLADRPWAAAGLFVSVPAKLLGCVALLLSIPVTREYGLIAAFRQAGWVAGRLSAVAGRVSKLYAKPTGY